MAVGNEITNLLSDALKICKEKEYIQLSELIHSSYLELVKVEAESRRIKSSALIKGIQLIEREKIKLDFEYKRVKIKFKIKNIDALDRYIEELDNYRKRLVKEKKSLI